MPEVLIKNVPVNFPYVPYEVQKNYMEKLMECLQTGQNGILESPTGTGKSLSLLCASLAWLEIKKAEHRAKALSIGIQDDAQSPLGNLSSQLQAATGSMWSQGAQSIGRPKIIFSSRTHSQLTQAIGELKKTSYRYMKTSILGSRDQMCVHPEISKETNNTNKVHMCQARVKGRTCYFYNQYETKKEDPEVRESILDLEDLVKLGKKRSFCPYYMSRELRKDADIIFLPYNYLLDPKSRRAHNIELQGNVVIFDEAHNVEKMCEESASLQLRSTDVALCIEEVTQVMKKLQEIAESSTVSGDNLLPEDFSAEDLCILKAIFLMLEKAIDEIEIPSDGAGKTLPGSFMFDLLEKADVTVQKKAIILDILDKLIQYLTTNSNSPFQRKGVGLQKFSDLIKIVFSKDLISHQYLELVKQCYKVHVNVEEKWKPNFKNEGWAPKNKALTSKKGKTLSYWCFNPGFGMKNLAEQGVHCLVLTSGTLSPLDSFTSELQIPFPIQLESPHIIKPCQVWVATICKGPDGTVLNSSYQNRSKPEYMTSLGQTILTFSRVIPGGLLVFFASYPIMKACQEHWEATGIWTRICSIKEIFVEPKTKDGFHSAMENFYTRVRDPKLRGACFMAVCRGKVSEGLDFANNNGRAVIITGLPYPPFKDPRVVLKQKYLEEMRFKNKKGLTGGNWYKLEASRAVNQAVGRVIRHKDDYGAIILCDKRFGDGNFKGELSAWIRPYMKVHQVFGPALREVIQFFRVTQSMFPAESSSFAKSSTIKIEYESNSSGCGSAVQPLTFRPTTNTTIVSASTRDKMLQAKIEKKVDLNDLYKENQPLLSSTQNKRPKSLFSSDLEASTSSILNFSAIAAQSDNSKESSSSSAISQKRKRIKLISQQDRDLQNFVDTQPKKSSQNLPEKTPSATNSSNTQSATEVKHSKIAKYLKEVKSTLSSEEYKNFASAIKDYKKTSDCEQMIASILSLFGEIESRRHLVLKFSVFLRPEHQDELESIYEESFK